MEWIQIVGWGVAGALAVLYGIYLFKLVRNRFAPVRTVNAVVVNKFKSETFSKYSGTGKYIQYVIVFSAEGKKRSFRVSEFSYGGYRIGETGTLKYKGDRLLDFC